MTARLADRRIRLLVAIFAVLFATALARVTWLQAVRAPGLDELATSQQRETLTLPAGRGTIYDRMGIELAVGEDAVTVYANPRQIRDPQRIAELVGQDLGLDPAEVLAKLGDRTRGFIYLARQADPGRAATLKERKLTGIGFYPEERRRYPLGRVAAGVIGYAGIDNEGLAGVEYAYDSALGGEDGEETIVRDPFGRLLDVVDTQPVREGKDVSLTLDHRIQAHVEKVLRETRARWNAKAVTAIVLDPRTGGVLAMAVEPGFNANRYSTAPADRVRSRAVTDLYEPGSTFKVVTVAAALDDQIVAPGTAFTLPYELEVADRVIHDAEERGTERMTVSQILSRSSNVGAVTLAQLIGKDRLAWWIERFGFGRQTGVDFPGESEGIVLPSEGWTGSTIGNVPIGQGIAVTPLQMAAVYAAIANGGVWRQPHLAERIGGHELAASKERRIVSEQTARLLTRMMADVVSQGTGTLAHVPGYTVAGKTGTGEKPDETGGYSETRYVASFVGFAPTRSARVAVLVVVDEPEGEIYGGVVAAPAFAKIAEFALQYLDVPPDAPASDTA